MFERSHAAAGTDGSLSPQNRQRIDHDIIRQDEGGSRKKTGRSRASARRGRLRANHDTKFTVIYFGSVSGIKKEGELCKGARQDAKHRFVGRRHVLVQRRPDREKSGRQSRKNIGQSMEWDVIRLGIALFVWCPFSLPATTARATTRPSHQNPGRTPHCRTVPVGMTRGRSS